MSDIISNQELETRVISILEECSSTLSAGEIAQKIYGKSFSRKVNPTLYHLLKEGKIVKTENKPPLWKKA